MTTRGFDANLPARKPRPITRVISELTAGSDTAKPAAVIDPVMPEPVALLPTEKVTPPPAAPRPAPPKASVAGAKSGRERTAALRERLAAVARGSAEAEPQQTAAAVRELIEVLRTKLASAIEERSRLAVDLDEVRAALGRTEAELKKERRTRAALEAQAEERRRIADEAVAEAEALAAERDQVLEEIAGLRGLEEQVALLQEAEAELADLETRLQEEQAGRARAEARCRELTSEVERLAKAGEALEALESLVRRPPPA